MLLKTYDEHEIGNSKGLWSTSNMLQRMLSPEEQAHIVLSQLSLNALQILQNNYQEFFLQSEIWRYTIQISLLLLVIWMAYLILFFWRLNA